MKPLFAFIAIGTLAAACSTPRLVGSDTIRVVEATQLPAPSTEDTAGVDRDYVLGPGDSISVDVFGVSEVSRTVQADSLGRIALPLVGEIDITGQRVSTLAEQIEQRLRGSYVRDPQVTVNLTEARSQVMTVDGEVDQPGLYPVVGRMTLMRAIATARGTTEFARQRHVVVFRSVGQQKMAALYDLQAIRLGAYDDPDIYANDVIVVGESNSRRVFGTLLQAGTLLVAPLIAVLQR